MEPSTHNPGCDSTLDAALISCNKVDPENAASISGGASPLYCSDAVMSSANQPTTDIIPLDLDFLFHMFFLARYCKLLEENSLRGKTADFLYKLLFGATVLTGIVLIGGMIPYLSASFAKFIFPNNSLTFTMATNSKIHIISYQSCNLYC